MPAIAQTHIGMTWLLHHVQKRKFTFPPCEFMEKLYFCIGFAPVRWRLNITFGCVGQKQYKPGLVHRNKNTPTRSTCMVH